VPFGEYLPFQPTLEAIGLEQLTRIRGGFDIGPTPRPLLRIAGLPPFAPLICYEAIFPGTVVQSAERPAALLNITNDGWFGNTTGPRQHLHQARVRAVEEGLPVIRSANNGISAVIDARGRIVASLDLDVAGVIDATLPAPRSPPLYARFADGIFAALLLLAVARLFAWRPRHATCSRPEAGKQA
jgi:apolipoprotein N-acyltransferase